MTRQEYEEILQMKSVFYAKELWGANYDWPVILNGRLRKNLGIFAATTDKECWIEINPKIVEYDYVSDCILLHELCHWWLWSIGRNWKDNAPEFILECRRIGERDIFENEDLTKFAPTDKMVELVKKFERSL
mgnify:CR=1 FL=1